MKVFENVSLEYFDLSLSDIVISDQMVIVTKKSWAYELAHEFQELMVEKVAEHPEESVLIFCSHPSCLTLGKGLQKSAEDVVALIDFDPQLESLLDTSLGIKVHRIKRGGGITFHHENQLIFYPIVALENKKLKVFDFLLIILEKTKEALKKAYGVESDVRTDLLGLWLNNYKVASIGISARKFISYHGLALNLKEDAKIEEAFKMIYPCGLSSSYYQSLEKILKKEVSFEIIQSHLLEEIQTVLR